MSETKNIQSDIIIRKATQQDVQSLVALNKKCFPAMAEENIVWSQAQLLNHQRLFPVGQLVAVYKNEIVGAVSSLIISLGIDPYRDHTYAGISDGGYFHNHDPQGDTLYGADVYVDPDMQGKDIGHLLYEARRELCVTMNLKRILAGGRISGYSVYANEMSPDEYVKNVENGVFKDPVLSFQLREGFVVRGILKQYISDPKSKNFATLIEWKNKSYVAKNNSDRKARIACVQYKVRGIETFEDFADQVEYFVETAADYRADFVLFPEFFSVQLLSQKELRKLPSVDGIQKLADLEKPFMELMCRLAKEYGIHIIAGSHPMRRGNKLLNMCPIILPDGTYVLQPKIHVTPAEKKYWGIDGGDELHVIATPKAKIGVLICYDSEFPEAARYLADQGAEIIFIPYCTDDRQGYLRVRYCSQARAIENQVYVATGGIIGNLPNVSAMDIHYGKAAVFCPSDFNFARDGIQAEADSNVEMLLITDVDINDLYRSRASGSVTPRLDRRRDLFHFSSSLKNDADATVDTNITPMNFTRE